MSPTSTARNRSTLRKIVLSATAIVVTLVPTACGSAYAASAHAGHSSEVVEVGGVAAAEPIADEEGAAANDTAPEEGAAEQGA